MRSCGTLVIGSCYYALGMAVGGQDVLICEESENCDTRFYATFRSFQQGVAQPATEEGRSLREVFRQLKLLRPDSLDLCGAETAFCRFALDKEVPILLKCRVVDIRPEEGGYRCTLVNNAGLETVLARRVIDTRCRGRLQAFTLLFTAAETEAVEQLFPEGRIEPAFRDDLWALHIPVPAGTEYNTVLESVCRRWETGSGKEKLLCFGSRLAQLAPEEDTVGDERFADPVSAFEAGLAFARKEGL